MSLLGRQFLFKIALVLGLVLLLPQLTSAQSKREADSLLRAWNNKRLSDSLRLDALTKYSWPYLFKKNDTIEILIADLEKFARRADIPFWHASNFNVRGIRNALAGNLDEARGYFEKALEIYEELGQPKYISQLLNNLGNIYRSEGNYKVAIDYFMQGFKYVEVEDHRGRAMLSNNIGILYKELDDYDNANKYYRKALAGQRKVGLIELQADVLNNIGTVHRATDELDSAIYYFELAISMYDSSGYMSRAGNPMMNLGRVYLQREDFGQARRHILESIEMAKMTQNLEATISSNALMGRFFLDMNKPDSAIISCQIAYDAGAYGGYPGHFRTACECLFQAYDIKGDASKALRYFKEFIELRDSLQGLETATEIARKEVSSQYQIKNYKDSLQQLEEDQERKLADQKRAAKIKAEHDEEIRQQNAYILWTSVGLGVIGLFFLLLLRGYRNKRKANEMISRQKEIVELKNKEITDSINYARRIQEAILPTDEQFSTALPESFILFKPKDIVAGDFYWMENVNGTTYFAAADCTGHGVPGAMVSVVCSNALSKSLIEEGIKEPGKILDRARELVIDRFGGSEREMNDGMDIALVALPQQPGKVWYAGANNPLWVVRDGELLEYKADKQPIGRYGHQQPFTNHELELVSGDTLYVFSDGFVDQFGGIRGKKYKSSNFKTKLVEISSAPLSEQKNILLQEFEVWRGDNEQIDDICIIGVRI